MSLILWITASISKCLSSNHQINVLTLHGRNHPRAFRWLHWEIAMYLFLNIIEHLNILFDARLERVRYLFPEEQSSSPIFLLIAQRHSDTRDIRLGLKLDQIGTKWDIIRTFSDQILVHFGTSRQKNVNHSGTDFLRSDFDIYWDCEIWKSPECGQFLGLFDPLLAQIWNHYHIRLSPWIKTIIRINNESTHGATKQPLSQSNLPSQHDTTLQGW